MATTQEQPVKLTVDRQTRDDLCREIQLDSTSLGDLAAYVDEGDRHKASQLRDLACLTVDLLDALGWAEEGDRDTYSIEMDRDRLCTWLTKRASECRGCVGENVISLRRQEGGDEDHFYCGHSQEESIAKSRELIERDMRTEDILMKLLANLRDQRAEAVA